MCINDEQLTLSVEKTSNQCPIGETIGKQNMAEGKIPVYSCEGACIRGEIARKAANLVAKRDPYRRGCHGELFTVPDSAIAEWTLASEKAILIDGCFLRCHGRIMEKLIGKEKLIQFDALSHYKKYTDIFDMDDVSEAERNQVATSVADWVLDALKQPCRAEKTTPSETACGSCCN